MEASASAKPNLPQRVGRYDVVGRLDSGGMAEILLGRLSGARLNDRRAPLNLLQFNPPEFHAPSFQRSAAIAARARSTSLW